MSDTTPKPAPLPIDTSYGAGDRPIDTAFRVALAAQPPKAKVGRRVTVCAAKDIPPGSRRIVETPGHSIGVFNIAGTFHAVRNVCPHYGAPLCQGSVHATHKPAGVHQYEPALEGRVLRCPWHGWEFDIPTGKGLYDKNSKVMTYPVEVDANGDVVITV
jgi:nitrite reductase (NADH) small subunit